MNKNEFLYKLDERLSSLTEEEREKTLNYYSEMIDDRVEDGESEEQAIADFGDFDEVVKSAVNQLPMVIENGETPYDEKPNVRFSKKKMIVILAVGSPIWISLLAIALSLAVSVFAIWLSLAITAISMVIGGVGAVLLSPMFFMQNVSTGILSIGAGLLCAGLGVFACLGMIPLTKYLLRFTKFCFGKCTGFFRKRRTSK